MALGQPSRKLALSQRVSGFPYIPGEGTWAETVRQPVASNIILKGELLGAYKMLMALIVRHHDGPQSELDAWRPEDESNALPQQLRASITERDPLKFRDSQKAVDRVINGRRMHRLGRPLVDIADWSQTTLDLHNGGTLKVSLHRLILHIRSGGYFGDVKSRTSLVKTMQIAPLPPDVCEFLELVPPPLDPSSNESTLAKIASDCGRSRAFMLKQVNAAKMPRVVRMVSNGEAEFYNRAAFGLPPLL